MKKMTVLLLIICAAFCVKLVAKTVYVPAWGQCGGTNWTGAHTCVSGYTCKRINDAYYQCQP